MFALSTSWNAWKYSHAKGIIEEIRGLGFQRVELNFALTTGIVKEMISLKRRGVMEVVSVHNFCPIPNGISRKQALPDTFSLASLDEGEREKAVYFTRKSIDTAAKISAQALVLHVGKVQIEERIRTLALAYDSGDRQSYNRLKAQMEKERKAKAKKAFSQVLKSLEQLCHYAQKQKVKLGIENRYYFCEIPSIKEMEIIFKTFPHPTICYWHDVGHAQVYENLGLIKHKMILDKFSQRMVGVHLHDIEGIDDHRAPLKGKFDFTLLKPYINRTTLCVLEPHYPATGAEIIRGKKYLQRIFSNK